MFKKEAKLAMKVTIIFALVIVFIIAILTQSLFAIKTTLGIATVGLSLILITALIDKFLN